MPLDRYEEDRNLHQAPCAFMWVSETRIGVSDWDIRSSKRSREKNVREKKLNLTIDELLQGSITLEMWLPSNGTLRMIITWPKAWSWSCLKWKRVRGVRGLGSQKEFGRLGEGQFNTWEGTLNSGINLKRFDSHARAYITYFLSKSVVLQVKHVPSYSCYPQSK